MKLAASTLGCPNWTFDQILDNYASYGISGVEIRGINGIMDAEKIPEFMPENLPETKRKMLEHGLTFVSFGTSINLHAKKDRQALVESFLPTVDVCARAGIPAIRVFGNDVPDTVNKDGEEREIVFARIIGNLSAICDYARLRGIRVNLEIHGTINSIRNLAPILIGCGHIANFGILWDVEHSYKTMGDDYLPFYRLIRPYLRHVHFKDCRYDADKSEYLLTEVGEGTIPLQSIAETLMADGYSGYVSLEWEKRWHPEIDEPEIAFPTFVKFMKRIGAAE